MTVILRAILMFKTEKQGAKDVKNQKIFAETGVFFTFNKSYK